MSQRANYAMATMVSVLILTLIACGAYGLFTAWQASQDAKAAKEKLQQENNATLATLLSAAEYLDGQLTESGYYDRNAVESLLGGQPDLLDAWGTPIIIGYSDTSSVEYVTVSSAGPDGFLNTADDLRVRKRNLVPTEVGEAAGEGVRGLVRGLFEKQESPDEQEND